MRSPENSLSAVAVVANIDGNLTALEAIANERDVRLILHCGDFGFYDEESYSEIPLQKLLKKIRNANIAKSTRARLLKMSEEQLRQAAKELKVLGVLTDYIRGGRRFLKPVYTIWGCNEDVNVIQRLWRQPIKNLIIVTPMDAYDLGGFVLMGCGGKTNLDDLFQVPYMGYEKLAISGMRMSPLSSLMDFTTLLHTAREARTDKPRVLLLNDGDGSDPLVSKFIKLMAWNVKAKITYTSNSPGKNDEMVANENNFLLDDSYDDLYETFEKFFARYPLAQSRIESFSPIRYRNPRMMLDIMSLGHVNCSCFIELRPSLFNKRNTPEPLETKFQNQKRQIGFIPVVQFDGSFHARKDREPQGQICIEEKN